MVRVEVIIQVRDLTILVPFPTCAYAGVARNANLVYFLCMGCDRLWLYV